VQRRVIGMPGHLGTGSYEMKCRLAGPNMVRTTPRKECAKKCFKSRVQEPWCTLKDKTKMIKTTKAFRLALFSNREPLVYPIPIYWHHHHKGK
jgi:hypothetical protein